MTIIQSRTSLWDLTPEWWPNLAHSLTLYESVVQDYDTLYKTQPNIRVCVDFLSRNLAQLGLHVYKRRDDGGREKMRDHPLAVLIKRPLPIEHKVTRFRLFETLMGDLGVYFNAYWLKIRNEERMITGLLRIPPEIVNVKGGLTPDYYLVEFGGDRGQERFERNEIVHFRGYNATNPIMGLSPLETLRRVLAEEYAMGDYREQFWQNAARMGGVLERPAGAPDWSDSARSRFKKEFEELYSGSDGSGKTAILEEGMTWKVATFNPRESEYLSSRKLSREECARAYHIPPPLIGILDNATYSNIETQHKALYTDVLGPVMTMVAQEIELQLLSEYEDPDQYYLEFNIQEKLRGDFEEQTRSLQSAVGRPWMTANEARAIMNMANIEGGDELITPLNVLVGGQANPRDSAPNNPSTDPKKTKSYKLRVEEPDLQEHYLEEWQKLVKKTFERQQNYILPKLKAITKDKKSISLEAIWDAQRWDEEFTEDMAELNFINAFAWAEYLGSKLALSIEELTEVKTYLTDWSYREAIMSARNINRSTRLQIESVIEGLTPYEDISSIFEKAMTRRLFVIALARSLLLMHKGSITSARKRLTSKTWIVTSGNPRDSHAALNGQTVGIRDTFSNGMKYPGDYSGGAEENANCQCILEYGYE